MKRRIRAYVIGRSLSLYLITILLLMSCLPLFRGIQSMKDLRAPAFISVEQPDNTTLLLSFDQSVNARVEDFISHGDFSLNGVAAEDRMLRVSIQDADDPGREYFIEGRVEDDSGNSLWFILPFYGFNNSRAVLVLSEFINENSKSRYEKVELYVSQAGNLGGITVYNGAAGEHKAKMVFASQEVEAGEYLVVHFRSLEGDDAETGQVDEYGTEEEVLNRASSPQATANVRDFWAEGSQGLSDTNGALSIYHNPSAEAELMDAMLYSNRSFDPDSDHGSFGTAYTWAVMQAIFKAGGWVAENDTIRPEDCLRTEASTSTRSLNRDPLFSDSNSPSDWHIVPTGKSSFGKENSTEVHESS